MVKLGVNIDHIATVRQARLSAVPDIAAAAAACERAGATGITVHLREDRRHIQDADVERLRGSLTTKLNLEMAVSEDIAAVALRVRPEDVCLVPEKRRELTTEGGLDAVAGLEKISDMVKRLRGAGIRVSLFIDPTVEQVQAAARCGADCVELHTGRYADSLPQARPAELERLKTAARRAVDLGLTLNAGHGLDYDNVAPVAAIPGMSELNIGFAIVARAVFVGLEQAVREMIAAIGRGEV